ncbi:hypothetical protein DFQ29_005527 [Apophysomyces sp. BC1021]|nr:hypothetical protein DFQ29_005527 [Apophysomyces sp. BC1021]
MWLCGSVLTCSVTVMPLILGRYMFETYLVPGTQVHDIYAFSVGAYAMVILGIVVNWFGQRYNAIMEMVSWKDCVNEAVAASRQKLVLACKAVYFGAAFGFIIPLLLGVAVDLFVFMPIRFSKSSGALVLHLSEDWSFGVVYLGIVYGVIYVLPTNVLQRTLDQAVGNGISEMDTWEITRLAIAPIIAGTSMAILFPGALALGTISTLGVDDLPILGLDLCRWNEVNPGVDADGPG